MRKMAIEARMTLPPSSHPFPYPSLPRSLPPYLDLQDRDAVPQRRRSSFVHALPLAAAHLVLDDVES